MGANDLTPVKAHFEVVPLTTAGQGQVRGGDVCIKTVTPILKLAVVGGALLWFRSNEISAFLHPFLCFRLKFLCHLHNVTISLPLPSPPFLCLGVTPSNKDGRPKRRINHILRSPLLSEQLARRGAVTDFSAESIRLARQPRSALFLKSVNRPPILRSHR